MRKIFLLIFIGSFVFADVLTIITKIKQMEKYKPVFKTVPAYNIFTKDIEINKSKITAVPKQNSLVLNAIFQNKANINGIWVKRGDNIEGYVVVKITDKEVVLKKDNIYKKLSLTPKVLKVAK
ncbi:hypothetical protein C3L23_07200 [Nautilia sp. PV-1]|uniref:hypothetical protein n=1 Tax=Nautilia sp. PV-1 TaxID=2579250 RepID=UPI000FD72AE8|nr:hypothetical protein [Nautilia sp. PV-1]AZV47065.1 hypothetical protein C3L23_07200 [Nautilia sp. PV-1]